MFSKRSLTILLTLTLQFLAIFSLPTVPYSFPGEILRTWSENGGTRFEAQCVFSVPKTIKPLKKNFILDFGRTVKNFESWVGKKIFPTGRVGSVFHLKNLHWLHPEKQELNFQATYFGGDSPTIMCKSDLPHYPPYDTTANVVTTTTEAATTTTTTEATTTQLTIPTPLNEFPATILRNWTDNGAFRIEALCTFEVLKSTEPEREDIIIDFQMPVQRFETWVGKAITPEVDYGDVFHMTNLHWLHPPKQDFFFQANYEGTTDPPVPLCRSTLDEYVPPTTTTSATTTAETTTTTTSTTTTGPSSTESSTESSTSSGTSSSTSGTTTSGTSTSTSGTTTSVTSTDSSTTESSSNPSSTTAGSSTQSSTTEGSTTKSSTQSSTTTASSTTSGSTTTLTPAKYNYEEVIEKSIWFYRAQRSGDLPEVPNDPVPWRGDSALYDGSDVGEDLTGGWYDAGDWVKFNFPISSATAILAWGLVQWEQAYISVGLQNEMLDCIKWSLDYFLKCWKPDQQILYGQVGNGNIDHSKMMRPEDMTQSNMPRPAYKVTSSGGGSDLAGSMVAAFAAGAMAFQTDDPTYSSKLLEAAKSLYTFADTYRGSYTSEINDAGSFYPSSGYNDELVYAAAMLYKATGNTNYLADAESKYSQFGFDSESSWAFDWSDKLMGARLLLFEATGDSKYSREIQKFINDWKSGGTIQQTPGGLAWRAQWGSLRYSANAAFVAMMAADLGISPASNIAWAESQIHYMLGDNPRQSSYVVGFGNNPPKNPHHKSSTCEAPPAPCDWNVYSSSADNAHVLYGALVGGPDANDNYKDVRTDYIMAEVTCDYNAGFHSAVAGTNFN